nr:hypothetical protein [Tanacetum cinerariifolium]
MYHDMTYTLLVEIVVKRFNLNPNVRLNLSFNLHSLNSHLDITDDEDVKIFFTMLLISLIEYHIYTLVNLKKRSKINTWSSWYSTSVVALKNANVMEGGHGNVMPTQEYVRKIIEDAFEDDHFTRGPWLSAVVYLHVEGVMASGCLGNMKNYCKNGKLEMVVGVIISCTPNALRDLKVTLKDPSGIMGGTIHYKVFKDEEGYARSVNVRAVLILCNVSVFTPKPSNHYLNITLRNIVKVFDKELYF